MTSRGWTKRTRWLVALGALVAALAIAPSYIRAYRVFGASDAPSFLVGERIIANNAAYDLRLPYTGIVLFAHSNPKRGDVVMFRAPGEEYLVFKRVIGCPGDRVVMRDHQLEINGKALRYERVDDKRFQPIAEENKLGAIVEEEIGNGVSHLVSYTRGQGAHASFDAVLVPEGQYFLLGDNRGNSEDSRMYGPVARQSIQGRVIR